MATVKALNQAVPDQPGSEPVWNQMQKRFLAVLEDPENRKKSIMDICRLAGWAGTSPWYKATGDERFALVVEELRGKPLLRGDGWTKAQHRFLEVLADPALRDRSVYQIYTAAGYTSADAWYRSIRSRKFRDALAALGVEAKRTYETHAEVTLAKDPNEELARDVWDMRRLKPDYPRHRNASSFRVDFTPIENRLLRAQVKMYARHRLPKWKAQTFRVTLDLVISMLKSLPADVHIGTLTREHILNLIPRMGHLSPNGQFRTLFAVRQMLEYMASSKAWTGPRPPRFLIWPEDVPHREEPLPRPLPPEVIDQIDALLESAVATMKAGEKPPILTPMHWDALVVLRKTGMRFEDLAHLKVPDAQDRNGCLDQDSDGYWWIRIHHKFNKMSKDHRIPTRMSDGVVDAIRRQRERVQNLPNHFGENYLFRTERGVISYSGFLHVMTQLAQHLKFEGAPYKPAPHQFRHTIATDMIEQGVDIFTVKEFLGHSSLAMTQKYIKVYLSSLKAKYDAYRSKRQPTFAAVIAEGMDRSEVAFGADDDSGWEKDRVGKLYRSPLPNGLGVCVHLPMMDPCPSPPVCGFCSKLRVEKRHLPLWETALTNHQRTMELLSANPTQYDRAIQRHRPYLEKAKQIVEVVIREGFYDGRIHNT